MDAPQDCQKFWLDIDQPELGLLSFKVETMASFKHYCSTADLWESLNCSMKAAAKDGWFEYVGKAKCDTLSSMRVIKVIWICAAEINESVDIQSGQWHGVAPHVFSGDWLMLAF